VIGIVAVGVAVVVATVLVIHYSKKRKITGCVNSGESGRLSPTKKTSESVVLSGNMVGVKPGDRLTLPGHKSKLKAPDTTLVWETKAVTKDFGVCQP
jgi:hypothetical protein